MPLCFNGGDRTREEDQCLNLSDNERVVGPRAERREGTSVCVQSEVKARAKKEEEEERLCCMAMQGQQQSRSWLVLPRGPTHCGLQRHLCLPFHTYGYIWILMK